MNTDYLTVIIVNLALLLIASWVLGFIIFGRLLKEKQQLESKLETTRKKLKQKKPAQPLADPDYPLDPILQNIGDESTLDLLQAMDTLNNDLLEKEQQLVNLAALHTQQQAILAGWQGDSDGDSLENLRNNQTETQTIIGQLQSDLKTSQQQVQSLENKLREGQDKDGRIAVLEETERRLRERLKNTKTNQEQAGVLADGLRKANDKNQRLRQDNDKLNKNIRQLVNASQEQLATIKSLTGKVDQMAKLENHQQSLITEMEHKLEEEKQLNNKEAVKELETKLEEVKATLERTLREKEFIESHLLEMDQALKNAKETEAALERARKEIETLEMYFPEFAPDDDDSNDSTGADEHSPLPTLTITEKDDPELFNVIQDNRLFGILQEFWMTLDTPPLHTISEENIARPKSLKYWVKTAIDNDIYLIIIGADPAMAELLGKAIFKDTEQVSAESDFKDALGELGNLLAGTLANELNPTFNVGISEHLSNEDMLQQLDKVAIAAELLVKASEYPLYIALVKPTEAI